MSEECKDNNDVNSEETGLIDWYEGAGKIKIASIITKWSKRIFKFLLIFLIINILIFIPIVLGQLKSPRYPAARAYLKSSFMINRLYIFPLSKVFGYGNPLTWGFYPIKDALYKVGMSKLPKNEGEREIWWYNIRFVEFKVVAQPTLSDSYTYNDKSYKPLPDWQVRSFERWNDELYQHIQSLPKAKISDPKLAKTKLMIFLDLADAYIHSTFVLDTKLQITQYGYSKEAHKDHLPYPRPEAVKNYMDVINIFNKLKSDSAKNDKEIYNYFEKKKKFEEDKFLYTATLELLKSESQWGKIVCDSPEVTILGESHKGLMEYYIKNKKDLKFGESGTLEILTSGGISGFTNKLCKSTISLKEYNEYFIKKSIEFEKLKRGEK